LCIMPFKAANPRIFLPDAVGYFLPNTPPDD
jgi:hypothetical protein